MCFLQIPSATVLNHLLIFSIGLPFASSSTSLSSCLTFFIAESSIVSTCTPQIFPVIYSERGFHEGAPAIIYTYKQYWTCSPNLILFTSCYYCFLFHVVCKIRGYNLPCNFYSKCNITFSVHAYFFCQVLFYIHYFNVLTKCGIRLLNNHLWYFQAK